MQMDSNLRKNDLQLPHLHYSKMVNLIAILMLTREIITNRFSPKVVVNEMVSHHYFNQKWHSHHHGSDIRRCGGMTNWNCVRNEACKTWHLRTFPNFHKDVHWCTVVWEISSVEILCKPSNVQKLNAQHISLHGNFFYTLSICAK